MLRLLLFRILLVSTLSLALILSGCQEQAAPTAPAVRPPAEVGVVTMTPEVLVLSSELSGRTAPCRIAEVRPQVGGIIQKRLFREGATVRAGEALYQIDPALYMASVASAEASLARAEANLVPAKLKAERYAGLLESRAVSPQDHDDAQAALKLAEAEVAAAKAAVESARIQLNYTTITAPISGRIGRSSVTAGALVSVGQATALATIQQLDPIFVDVTRSSSEMLQLKRQIASGTLKTDASGAAKVTLSFEDGSPYAEVGKLKFSEVSVSQSTGMVTLRTEFPNPKQMLLPGMFVRATLEEGVNETALLVPQRGVSRAPDGSAMVMLVDAEEKVAVRPIKVLRTIGENWLVQEGLNPGDRVIVEGLQKARPGSVVKALTFGKVTAQP